MRNSSLQEFDNSTSASDQRRATERKNPEFSIVIPVFNSEKTLRALIERIRGVFEKEITPEFEIILIDDGSSDNSWLELVGLHNEDRRVKIIQHMRNYGQHNSLMCGFNHCSGDFVITMDDDLQNPPEEIPKLTRKIMEGYDLVYGKYISKAHNSFRNSGSMLIQFFYKRIFSLPNELTAFRIIRRQLVETILNHDKNYVFIDGLLAWNSRRIATVQVRHEMRAHGRSGYSLRKLITLSLNMLTNFSIFPLQIASFLGIMFSLVGFTLGAVFLIKKLIFDVPVMGYTSIMVALTMFSGIQLLTLGLIGEYIGRIHLNNNRRTPFHIREMRL